MEGNVGADDSVLTTKLRADVNENYRDLNLNYDLYWNVSSATVTAAAGATYITLSTSVNNILYVLDPNGKYMDSRELSRHFTHASEIESKCRTNTYSVRGVNATTGAIELSLVPAASAGNYTIYYTAIPADLAADGDYPKGPATVGDYLVWRTRYTRLLADSERPNLIQQTQQRSQEILNGLLKKNAHTMVGLFRGFPARA
jgi:hypothetical protein